MGFTPPLLIENDPRPSVWGQVHAWELGLLGAILDDPSIFLRVRDLVSSEDFSTGLHSRLFEVFERADGHGGCADRSAIANRLGVYAWDAEDGVPAYLDRLIDVRAPADQSAFLASEIHAVAAVRREAPEPVDVDSVAWSHRQADLLMRLAEQPDALSRQVDWQSIIAEVLYVGRSQTGGVVRKMELVFEHLLKALSDPDAPSRNRWRIEIRAWVTRIGHEATPSMRRLIDLDAAWRRGCLDAGADLAEYGARLPRSVPDTCPFTFDELTRRAPTFDALLEKLAASIDITPTEKP
ncbi:DUF29 family protein [uncultured Methylobacterium sp.]|uniref:DUF29 family protein n=1 Tax=uncultured Methylobacterium sp. TaxID=157278 RepID=UPI0035C98E1A